MFELVTDLTEIVIMHRWICAFLKTSEMTRSSTRAESLCQLDQWTRGEVCSSSVNNGSSSSRCNVRWTGDEAILSFHSVKCCSYVGMSLRSYSPETKADVTLLHQPTTTDQRDRQALIELPSKTFLIGRLPRSVDRWTLTYLQHRPTPFFNVNESAWRGGQCAFFLQWHSADKVKEMYTDRIGSVVICLFVIDGEKGPTGCFA